MKRSTLPYRTSMALSAGAILLLTGAAPVWAQPATEADATATVTIRMLERLSIQGTNDLNFGDVVAAQTGTTKRVLKSDPEAGQFLVAGSGNQKVQVSFTAPSVLTRVDGSGQIAVNLQVYGAPTIAGAPSAQQLFENDTIALTNGRAYFFIAGSLTVGSATSNPPGTYSGQFELSVSYASI